MSYTIVVPLDGSKWSEAVLPFAKEIAQARSGEVVLTWVAPSIWIDEILTPNQLEELQARHQHDCRDYLEGIAQNMRRENIAVKTLLATGDKPAEHIVEVAELSHANLIAMSTHGRSGLQRLMIGSTADKVIHQSHIPVLLVRPEEQ